jgi:BirA family biotin operon repressor/biotin-[acetyl-CoA-carboxylase] ligase
MRLSEREQAFLSTCQTRELGRLVEWHDTLPSTQDRASELAAGGAPQGALVVAVVQTAGRGRKGDVWYSPPGGLWASLVLRPTVEAQRAAGLTVMFARAVRDALHYDFCLPATVKEPNDVLVGAKKIAGIMADASSRAGEDTLERMVMGFGVNVANPAPAVPGGLATSMADSLKEPPRLEHLLARILERFEAQYLPRPRASSLLPFFGCTW